MQLEAPLSESGVQNNIWAPSAPLGETLLSLNGQTRREQTTLAPPYCAQIKCHPGCSGNHTVACKCQRGL